MWPHCHPSSLASRKAETHFIIAMAGKSTANVVMVGMQGSGKTTTLAKICELTKAFPEKPHAECQRLAKELGRPDCQHAWMLDRLASERELNGTMELNMQAFQTDSCCFTAIDTPGRSKLWGSLVSAISLSDIGMFVVPATSEYEASLSSGRLRELALTCYTMGVKNIIGLVTKMDDDTVQYNSDRFNAIKETVGGLLKEVGFKKDQPAFFPISGILGENLVSKSSNFGWYNGPSVLEHLDVVGGGISRPAEKPLRLPVLRVHDCGEEDTMIVGRVETGLLRPGSKLLFAPSGQVTQTASIQINGKTVSEARGGDIVAVTLSSCVADIRRGMVASSETNDPAAEVESFVAQVIVLDHHGFRAGYTPVLTVHTVQVPCEFDVLLALIDRKTGKDGQTNPEVVKTGDVVRAIMRPKKPVCVEIFSAYPTLGRFAVRDNGRTVAVGVIKEVTKRPILKRGDGNNYWSDKGDY